MSKPLVWGHRGASGYAPENTLFAFWKAAEMGADGVELDVQLTKDGELVVCHDEKIDRTSNGAGWIKDHTLSELRNFDFSCGNLEYEGAVIPTLGEVFDLLKPTGLTVNIELKTGIVFSSGIEEKVLDLVAEMGWEERVSYSSFNHYTIKRIKKLDPDARCGFLFEEIPIDVAEYGIRHNIEALHPSFYNLQLPGFIMDCHSKGLEVNVWSVNEKEQIKMCAELGVDAIITDYPAKAIEIYEGMI